MFANFWPFNINFINNSWVLITRELQSFNGRPVDEHVLINIFKYVGETNLIIKCHYSILCIPTQYFINCLSIYVDLILIFYILYRKLDRFIFPVWSVHDARLRSVQLLTSVDSYFIPIFVKILDVRGVLQYTCWLKYKFNVGQTVIWHNFCLIT